MRADIADVRLADQVFAPHYVQAMPTMVSDATSLRRDKPFWSETLAELVPGDAFDVLELAGDDAWGIAVALGLVGYVYRHALAAA